MTTINTIQDLIRILDENPEWMEELRSRLMPRAILELPDKLDQLSEEVRGLAAETRAFAADTNRRFALLDKRFDEIDRRFELVDKRFDEIDKRFDRMDRRFDRMDRRFDRMENKHTSWTGASMKHSGYAESKVVRQADIIADEIGLTWVRNLTYEEIKELVQRSDTSGMTPDDIRSFRTADVIMESRDEDGGTHYIPVEISFTADVRDTSRALRNARFMTRFTGSPAHPTVAGLRKDKEILELFESGTVHWYQLDDHDFQGRLKSRNEDTRRRTGRHRRGRRQPHPARRGPCHHAGREPRVRVP